MGIVIDQSAGTDIPTGEYTAKVARIEEATGKFGPQLKVKFILSGPPDVDGTSTCAWYGQTFSPKSKLYGLVQAAFGGTAIPTTYNFNSDDLINRVVRLVIVEKTKSDGAVFSKVDSVKPFKRQTPAAQAAPVVPADDPITPASPPAEGYVPF
jgi:hypothetical protein